MNNEDNKIEENGKLQTQNGDILVEYATDDKYYEAVEEFKVELAKQIAFSVENSDWKEIKKRLNETKDRLKALFLKEEDENNFNEQIRIAFENVNTRQSDELQKFELESQENFDSVIDNVRHAVEFAETNTDYKQARTNLLSVQDVFKNLRMKRSHKDELYRLVNAAFELVSKRQSDDRENYEMECIDNYHNMKQKIEAAINFANSSPIFAEARKSLINVQNLIKGLKLKREQRDELYKIIRDTFDKVNSRQEEERSQYESQTAENYITLKKSVDDAIEFANTSEDFSLSRERLIEVQGIIKSSKLKKEHRDELYGAIRSIFEVINEKQSAERSEYDAECNSNYEKLTEKVNDSFSLVHGLTEFNLIRESLITVQGEVKIAKLRKEQRNELFARIREAFSIFDKKKNEYFEQRKEDKAKKLKEIKLNLEEKIKRISDVLEKDLESLDIQKSKLSEAGDDEFLSNEILKKIENIELRIKEKQDSNAVSLNRIKEIDEEISKL